ncbi:MAG: nucleotidyl transferase AbiEii/AbiGii toxin family protein [bacterium]
MEFYHDLITEKSWQELKALNKTLGDFVLIGGWAVYLYTKTLKSKDIDILVGFDRLEKLGGEYDLYKNERLKKYEAVRGEVQIDIYLPHYSAIGIPVEDLMQETQEWEGFCVLKPEYLLALKIITLSERGRSPKGRKDFIDVMALIHSGKASYKKATALLRQYQLEDKATAFKEMLGENTDLPELSLNKHAYSKLKKVTG